MSRAKACTLAAALVAAWSQPARAEEPEPEPTEEERSEAQAVAEATPDDPLEGKRSHQVQKDVVPAVRGLTIALRAGWGAPQGSVEGGVRSSEVAVGLVPLWLDLGYRLSPRWWFGFYAQYGFVADPTCSGGGACRANDVRFGLQAQYHFGTRSTVDPWIGFGAGFEVYERKSDVLTERFSGFEFANLQFGQDWALGRRFGLGPFVSLSLDRFTSVTRESDARQQWQDSSIGRRAFHGWMLLGIRLSFGA